MKNILALFLFLIMQSALANLYLQTEYREGKNPKIVTKHHIFLEKRYPVNYTKKSYVLILKKVTNDEATIETESYDVDKIGHKTMHGGSLGTYKVGKEFTIKDQSPNGEILFSWKVLLEKIVSIKP